MKTIRLIILSACIFLFMYTAKGQRTDYYNSIQKKIDVAKQLYKHQKYVAAYREFEKIQNQADKKSEIYSEADYFKSVSALKSGYQTGEVLLKNYIEKHPESPYITTARFNIGQHYFEKKQYLRTIRSFKAVDRNDLSADDKTELQYQNGYANLMQKNTDVALSEFEAVMNTDNLYSKPAAYYWAHIQYLKENYPAALKGLKKLNNDPAYSQVIPIYISHIYYKQQRYNELASYTASVINDVPEKYKAELSKLTGDAYFHLKAYEKAIPYFEKYFEKKGEKTREESYALGFCYYQSGNYEKATSLLERATSGNDWLTQNACYLLADCFIRLNQKEKAKTAFNAASELDFDPQIKEDALFNYAKLTYELSYSPFNETIKTFDRYISQYPDSKHNAEAYRILSQVYLVTKNYKDAIASIEKIDNKTPEILKAYQRVTLYRGLEQFNNANFEGAIANFDRSMKNGKYNHKLNARAQYWKAEALYRTGDYDNAATAYKNFQQMPGTESIKEDTDYNYNTGYTCLKTGKKDKAAGHFSKYIHEMQGKRSTKIADAYNRLGDNYFTKSNYNQAIENYTMSYNMRLYEADYALLQIAFCLGLQQKQQEKISKLNLLLSGFPESEYRDDALYELGRAYERLDNNYEAIQQYRQIVNNYPESTFCRKALLQLGLVNYNNGEFKKALKQYKQVAENYRGTSEANAALSGIKNCYIELNNVDAYFNYVKKLGGNTNVSTSEQDELSYQAAERLYMEGDSNAQQQLEQYLQRFPNGTKSVNAHYYLAEIFYKEGKYTEANEHYTEIANQPDNIFSEAALSKASELQFNAQNYAIALNMFNRLEKLAENKWNILRANTGQMRCHLLNKAYQQAIIAAKKIKKTDIAGDALKNEADYTIGKANYELGNFHSAIDPLKDVARDTKLEKGAEAKYLLAEVYYKNNQKTKSEQEIANFVEKGTPYTYWLGKAFLLLANIYEDNGDTFQAKHTLKSLAENYNDENDGIIAEANKRLKIITDKENLQQQKAEDNSFQMEIKQN